MKWIETAALVALYDEASARFGGAPGLRDPEGPDAALARAENLAADYADAGAVSVAAFYASAIIRRHVLVDGNKRAALFAMAICLKINGFAFKAGNAALFHALDDLAAGDMTEAAFAAWLRTVAAKDDRP